MKAFIQIQRRAGLILLGALLVAGCTAPAPENPVWETTQDIQLIPARPVQSKSSPAGKTTNKGTTVRPQATGPTSGVTNPEVKKAQTSKKPKPPVKTPVVTPPPSQAVEKPAPLPVSPRTTAYQLRPGNPIRIDLLGIPDAQVIEDVIDEMGFISLMYIGEIKAAGKTAHELERVIEKRYIEQKIYKQISVNVVVQSKQYFVRGEVQRPGSFPLTAGATLSQAIAVSGGFTEFANLKKIRLSRGGKTRLVNFKDIEKDSRKDISLEAGDTIVVMRSVF